MAACVEATVPSVPTDKSSPAAAVHDVSNDDVRGTSLKAFPVRRIEPFVSKLIRTLQQNAAELRQRKSNIYKQTTTTTSSGSEDSQQVAAEYLAAIGCVARLTKSLQQIVNVRRQIVSGDLATFDCRMTLIFDELQLLDRSGERPTVHDPDSSVDGRRRDLTDSGQPLNVEQDDPHRTLDDNGASSHADDVTSVPTGESSQQVCNLSVQLDQNMNQLLEQLRQFYLTICESTVEAVSEQSKSPETASDTATDSHHQPASESVYSSISSSIGLLNSRNLKLLMIPVAGAMIGGAVAGPVGLVAGLKMGKIAAFSGTIVGMTTGTILTKHAEEKQLALDRDEHDEENARDSSINALPQTSPLINLV